MEEPWAEEWSHQKKRIQGRLRRRGEISDSGKQCKNERGKDAEIL